MSVVRMSVVRVALPEGHYGINSYEVRINIVMDSIQSARDVLDLGSPSQDVPISWKIGAEFEFCQSSRKF